MMRFILCALCLLIALQSAPAWAIDYYVESGVGSDSNPGTQAQPFANYYRCGAFLTAGSTCWIKQGISEYIVPNTGYSVPSTSGTSPSNTVTYRAFPGHTPSLRCAGTITTAANPACKAFVFSSGTVSYVSILDLTIHNVNYGVHFSGAIADHIVVTGNHIYDALAVAVQGQCAFCTVDKNNLHDFGDPTAPTFTLGYCLYLEGQGWTITDNICDRSYSIGVQLQGDTKVGHPNLSGFSGLVAGNTIAYSKNSAGLVINNNTGGPFTGTRVENNILFQPCFVPLSTGGRCATGAYAPFLSGGSATRSAILLQDIGAAGVIIRKNVSFDTDDPTGDSFLVCNVSGQGVRNEAGCNSIGMADTSGGNSKTVNPNMVNAPTGSAPATPDFHLTSSSTAALNTGLNLTACGITTDFDGVTRPAGSGTCASPTGAAWEIGVYEFGSSPQPDPPTRFAPGLNLRRTSWHPQLSF